MIVCVEEVSKHAMSGASFYCGTRGALDYWTRAQGIS